jgi:diacylglycerol kinase
LYYFFSKERNGRIQAGIALVVILLSFMLAISYLEWAVILICIGAVLSLEMLNSAIEKLCDLVQREYHPIIKIIKDISAAAVLWASMISAMIGTIILLPKILSLL